MLMTQFHCRATLPAEFSFDLEQVPPGHQHLRC